MEEGEHHAATYARSLVGTTLKSKWRLDALIGVGGMAAVFAATHRNGDRVAVKLLHPHVAVNPALRQRFLREGYTANSVQHPGVVRVQDDDALDDGSVFLVMELLSGKPLDDVWKDSGGKLPPVDVLKVGDQVLDVLAAAHSKGILHRDIKPENIFMVAEGRVKILDFGIAKVREASQGGESVTRTGTLMGTPAFMPPEQVMGKQVDATADLWAVGATIFTLLTGRFVHQAESVNEQLILAATVPAPPFKEVVPDAPDVLAAFIDKSLAFRKEDRYPNATEMQSALRATLLTLAPDWTPHVKRETNLVYAATVGSNPSGSSGPVSVRTPDKIIRTGGDRTSSADVSAGTISASTMDAVKVEKGSRAAGTASPTKSKAPIILGVVAVAAVGAALTLGLRTSGPSTALVASATADPPPPTTKISAEPAPPVATTAAGPTVTIAPATASSEPASSATPPTPPPQQTHGHGAAVTGGTKPPPPTPTKKPEGGGGDIFDKR